MSVGKFVISSELLNISINIWIHIRERRYIFLTEKMDYETVSQTKMECCSVLYIQSKFYVVFRHTLCVYAVLRNVIIKISDQYSILIKFMLSYFKTKIFMFFQLHQKHDEALYICIQFVRTIVRFENTIQEIAYEHTYV